MALQEWLRPRQQVYYRLNIKRGNARFRLDFRSAINDRKVAWQRCRVSLWYGRSNPLAEIATDAALWSPRGVPPLPIRLLLRNISKRIVNALALAA
jgi:hypothetical protein